LPPIYRETHITLTECHCLGYIPRKRIYRRPHNMAEITDTYINRRIRNRMYGGVRRREF